MDPFRRRFLKAGLAGAAVLAVAGGIAWFRRRVDAAALAPSLGEEARDVVRAIVPSLLAGALPPGAERATAIDETVAGVDRAIAGLLPAARAELAQLFALLTLGAGRRAFAGVTTAWRDATRDEVDAFLTSWQASAWALKRTAYDALHQLVLAAWYANPRSWPAIGYPGPPVVSPLHT
jgi:hypothetical protein